MFSIQRSEPSSVFRSTFGVASQFRRSESSSSLLGFGVQSHHYFLVSAFKAITVFSVWCSEPSLVFRSTFRVAPSVSTFRVVITSQFDVQSHHHHFLVSRSESSLCFQFGVQSHHHFLVSPFGAIISFQIDIQSRILGFGVRSRYHFSV